MVEKLHPSEKQHEIVPTELSVGVHLPKSGPQQDLATLPPLITAFLKKYKNIILSIQILK